jgi:hypothetical protein
LEECEEGPQIVLDEPSPRKSVHKHGVFLHTYAEEQHFPQVFAQVWKTLGGDQNAFAFDGRVRRFRTEARM